MFECGGGGIPSLQVGGEVDTTKFLLFLTYRVRKGTLNLCRTALISLGDVAQLVRASGSYPLCPGFESLHRHQSHKRRKPIKTVEARNPWRFWAFFHAFQAGEKVSYQPVEKRCLAKITSNKIKGLRG